MKATIYPEEAKAGIIGVGPYFERLCSVFVNDEQVRCVRFDTDEHWADVFVMDSDGAHMIVNDAPVVERVYGVIKYEWKD